MRPPNTFHTGAHHFNYGQKIFEIGKHSTLGIVTWGMAGLELGSYRTLAAKLGDQLTDNPLSSFVAIAERWIDLIWPTYSSLTAVQVCNALSAKEPFQQDIPPDPSRRTLQEEYQFRELRERLFVGFV